jgi:hypothetical protein
VEVPGYVHSAEYLDRIGKLARQEGLAVLDTFDYALVILDQISEYGYLQVPHLARVRLEDLQYRLIHGDLFTQSGYASLLLCVHLYLSMVSRKAWTLVLT